MLKNYFKIAWRSLGKQKSYGITNIVGFGIAITAILIISLWIQNELRYDQYHTNADRIYLIKNNYKYDNGNSSATENSPYAAISHLQNDFSDIEEVVYVKRPSEIEITNGNEVSSESQALYISEGWFDLFHYDFTYGNPSSFFTQLHSLIITEKKAKEYFGEINVVGKTLRFDSVDYEIQGVLKDIPSNSSLRYELFLPFYSNVNKSAPDDWMYFTNKVFIRLKEGSQPEKAERNIQYLFDKNVKWSQKGISVQTHLLPLAKLHFDKEISRAAFQLGNYQTVMIFFGLAILVLLVASINYINISIAKAVSRTKEIGARRIIGATRWQLFIQFITEAFLNSTLSLLLALFLMYLILPHFNRYFEIGLQFRLISFHVAALVIGIWFMMVFLTGFLPAIYLSSFKPVNLFRGSTVFQFGGKSIRKSLLISQFVLAVFMVIASITMYKQLDYIQNNTGNYDRLQVFSVEIPPITYPVQHKEGDENEWIEGMEKFEANSKRTIKNQLLANSPIENVSVSVQSSVLNETYQMVGQLDWDGKDPNFQPQYAAWKVDDNFSEIMNLELVQGEWFQKGDDQGLHQIVLNETAVREFEISQPVIGRRFYSNGNEAIISGIVKDFHFQDLHQKINPIVIEKKSHWGSHLIIKTQPKAAQEALLVTQRLFKEHFPGSVFSYKFLDDEFDQIYRKDHQTLLVALSFSMICIILSFIGLLGMVFFDVQQRIKEIGIRKVMGASVVSITKLLSTDFIRLVFIAILIASPITWLAMNKWLQDFAYRIEIQWWMFGVAGIMVLAVALLTVSFQAVKAAIANPVDSLRDE
jgi:ABC-type antimicrobial peptide transport system permease subunit